MTVTPSTGTLRVGETLQLRASAPGAKWSSSAPAVATVSASGIVTACGPGTVAITAKKGSQQPRATLIVQAAPVPDPMPPPDPEPPPPPPDPVPVPDPPPPPDPVPDPLPPPPPPDPVPAPGPAGVLSAADITYLGCFRVPGHVATSGVLAGRVVNGQLRFFLAGPGAGGSTPPSWDGDGFKYAQIAAGSSSTVFTLNAGHGAGYLVGQRLNIKRQAAGTAIPEHREISAISGDQITVSVALGGVPEAGDTIGREGDDIYEIADPGIYNPDHTVAPMAALVHWWGDVYQGRRCSWRAGVLKYPIDYQVLSSLYWHEANQLLYWGYYDAYNSTGEQDWAVGATRLETPTGASTRSRSTAYGPWRTYYLDADGHTRYGAASSALLSMAPDGTLAGAGAYFNVREWSWGPMLVGGAPWPTAVTPGGFGAPDLTLDDVYLQYYFMGQGGYNVTPNYFNPDGSVHGAFRSFRFPLSPNRNYQYCHRPDQLDPTGWSNPATAGQCSWNQACGASPGLLVDLGTKRGWLFAARIGGAITQDPASVDAAHVWYFNDVTAPVCAHGVQGGFPNTDTIAGPVSTQHVPMLIIYNPDDLSAAKNGTIPPYAPQASSWIDVKTQYGLRVAPKLDAFGRINVNSNHIGAMYFDKRRNILFVLAQQADETIPGFSTPLIHAFQLPP